MLRSKASWLSLSAFLFDLLAVLAAWLFAYLVRFNGSVPPDFLGGAEDGYFYYLRNPRSK